MIAKIGLEEHFAIEETLQDSAGFLAPSVWGELSSRLIDIHERRLREKITILCLMELVSRWGEGWAGWGAGLGWAGRGTLG